MGVIRMHRDGFMADARVKGKRRRQVFPTRVEAEDALVAWEAGTELPSTPVVRVTLGDIFDGWVAYRRAMGGKPGALRNARHSAHRLGRAFVRSTPAMGLTGRHIIRFLDECRAKGLRPASINHDLRAFKAALRWAADPDRGALLPRLPLRIKLVPEARINGASVRRQIITPEQFEELLDSAGSAKVRAVLAVCGLAGLRQGEALHLKIGDLDLDDRLILVREKPEADWSPKTYQERDVEMGPRLHGELSSYLETLSSEERLPDRWLFTSRNRPGERLRQVRPQVRRAYQRAGIDVPRGGCHTLRKTWATLAGEAGDYEALRELGGWSSWQAMSHYVAAGREQKRKIAERF